MLFVVFTFALLVNSINQRTSVLKGAWDLKLEIMTNGRTDRQTDGFIPIYKNEKKIGYVTFLKHQVLILNYKTGIMDTFLIFKHVDKDDRIYVSIVKKRKHFLYLKM